jgi:hypothetical protein
MPILILSTWFQHMKVSPTNCKQILYVVPNKRVHIYIHIFCIYYLYLHLLSSSNGKHGGSKKYCTDSDERMYVCGALMDD